MESRSTAGFVETMRKLIVKRLFMVNLWEYGPSDRALQRGDLGICDIINCDLSLTYYRHILVHMELHDHLDFEFDYQNPDVPPFNVQQQCVTRGVQHSCNTITGQLLTLV